jgi:flavorubredoxin
MPKMLILYYSRTGNTKKMADAVAEGAKMVQGVEVELNYYITPEALGNYDAILIGIPTYHHDMTVDMKNLFEEAAVKNVNLKGKTGAASGSYGWSGEAPRMIIEITKSKFEMNATEPLLLVKYAPDQAGLKKCRELGRKVAERLIHAT